MIKTFMYYDDNINEYVKYTLKRKENKELIIETEECVLKPGVGIEQLSEKLNSIINDEVLDFTELLSLYNPHHNNTYGNLYNQVQSIFNMYDVVSKNLISKEVINELLRYASKGHAQLVDLQKLSSAMISVHGNSLLMKTLKHDLMISSEENKVRNL